LKRVHEDTLWTYHDKARAVRCVFHYTYMVITQEGSKSYNKADATKHNTVSTSV